MADGVVTVVLEYLSDLLKEEANFLDGVKDRVNSLHAELRLINIFLNNSEGKRNDEIVKEVVRQIREVAYQAEDVIDSFILKVAEHRRCSAIGRIFHFPSHTVMLRNVGKKIAGIKEKINNIYNNKEKYGIERVEATVNAFEEEAMERLRREVEEDDVVGFVHDSTTLMKQLSEGDPKLDVISIIGMGGLGKTTLARKIYNNLRDVRHFNCLVWVCVSQDFRTRELLLKIIKELGMELEGKSGDELKKEVFEYLKGKRYLVVMDDIWTTKVWDEVRSAFPDNSNGSRILITSRKKEVALHASLTPPHLLPFLNKDESWELFRKKVFRGGMCPPELETHGRQIAEGCHGLPLSIVVLAGLLANKEKSLHIWSKFVGHVTSFLITRAEDTVICQNILSLSYTDLPRRLKPCFLYFGIYPEDFLIPVRQLMQLWVAEGFIQHTGHRFPEDVAEIYLEELIDRSLIQVASRRTDGGVQACRIHDLLRELCISESAEEKFLEVHSDNHSSTNNSRRLSIQGNTHRYMPSNPTVPTYARRSLFFFKERFSDQVEVSWTWVHENFQLLRVFSFEGITTRVSPKSIASLIHLRYLRIKFTGEPRDFPDSIGNLTNLETLYIKGSLLGGCLPKGIFKLQRLRNLYLPQSLLLPWDSEEALGNLQVLSAATINYDPQKHSFPVVPDKFPNVRKLKILIEASVKEIREANNIVSFPSLHHLPHLEILRIQGCGLMLPGVSNSIPSRITKLTLIGAVLKVGGSLTVLGKLPNLRILKLEEDHHLSDISIHVNADSFPQLQVLKLSYLRIQEWKLERGAMLSLRNLVVERCGQLTCSPELLSLRCRMQWWGSPRFKTTFDSLITDRRATNKRREEFVLVTSTS